MALAGMALALPSRLWADEKITHIKRSGKGLQLGFTPYELRLKHSFNLAKFSRTTTPDVLTTLSFDGITGYGEASMPPILEKALKV